MLNDINKLGLRLKHFLLLSVLFTFLQLDGQIQNDRNIHYAWKTDQDKALVALSEFQAVLPRGSFPKIDYPKFYVKEEGLKKFFKHEPVIAVEIDGWAKAYPLNMLTMHEISNDTLRGVPILPTYCPLCNASIVYDRRLNYDGETTTLTFEVSGMLRNSDMVMIDSETESWWQQLTGEALVGDLAGRSLDVIPSQVISVEDFFSRYPEGLILSKENSLELSAKYGLNPYEYYDEQRAPYDRFFPENAVSDRLPAMERVVDIEGKTGYKIYPFNLLQEKGVLHDNFDGPLVFFYKEGTVSVMNAPNIEQAADVGSITVFNPTVAGEQLQFIKSADHFKDKKTGSIWDITGHCIEGEMKGKNLEKVPHGSHFAFAWLAFHPQSLIFGQD